MNNVFGVYHNYTQKGHSSSWASMTNNNCFEDILPEGEDPNVFLAGGY
jgi:hypothetical protein